MCKIECLHMLGTYESERLKVTALNLFHPTASPLGAKVSLIHIVTQPLRGKRAGHLCPEQSRGILAHFDKSYLF